MRKKRGSGNRVGKLAGFIFIVIALFCLSSLAGFKLAEQKNNLESKKVIASGEVNSTGDNKQTKGNHDNQNIQDTSKESIPKDAKIAYLTFDDGPSANNTPKILDILKQNHIKATFFVIGKMVEENPNVLKREKSEGHVIGNHTYSHDYRYLYSDTGNFMRDLKKNEDIIHSVLGDYDTKLIRFPGGSFGKKSYKKAAKDNGYLYVDWNEETGDGEYQYPQVDQLITNFKRYDMGQKKMVVLMHDAPSKGTTVEVLPVVIKILRDEGYEFRPITSKDYEIMDKLFD